MKHNHLPPEINLYESGCSTIHIELLTNLTSLILWACFDFYFDVPNWKQTKFFMTQVYIWKIGIQFNGHRLCSSQTD